MTARKSTTKPKAKPKPTPKAKRKPAPPVILASAEGLGAETISEEPEGRPMGRPSSYDPAYPAQVLKLSEKGWTDEEMANFFDVDVRTFYRWRVEHDDFCQAIKLGKDQPDDRMELSLYHRGMGYAWQEEQAIKVRDVQFEEGRKVTETERVEVVKVTRRVPPDTAAMIFWLKNRRKERWRDKTDHELTGKDGKDLMPAASSRDLARAVVDILREAQLEGQPYDPSANDGEAAGSPGEAINVAAAEPPTGRRVYDPSAKRLVADA